MPDDVVGKISDSSFTSIPDEIEGIASYMKFPGIFVPAATWYLKRKVIKLAEFDLSTVSPLKAVSKISCPSVFGHAEGDQFVPFPHVQKLFHASINPLKFLMALTGSHNSRRDEGWIRLGVSFTLDCFHITVKNLQIWESHMLQERMAHFDSFDAMIAGVREVDDISIEVVEVAEQEPTLVIVEKNKETKKSKKKKHHHRRRSDVEVQTLDLFGLPPLGVSFVTPIEGEEKERIHCELIEMKGESDVQNVELPLEGSPVQGDGADVEAEGVDEKEMLGEESGGENVDTPQSDLKELAEAPRPEVDVQEVLSCAAEEINLGAGDPLKETEEIQQSFARLEEEPALSEAHEDPS
jgi:hypothetical protein